jgi:hypothetical protein
MQISDDNNMTPKQTERILENYRLAGIIELMKDDKKQLQQLLDLLGKKDIDAQKVIDNFT